MPALKIIWRGKTAYAQGTIGGKRIRRSLGTGSIRAAKEACAILEAREWQRYRNGPETCHTFAQAAIEYMKEGGERRFMTPLLHHFGETQLRHITAASITDAARTLYPDVKPATRNRQCIVPARAVINHAAALGWCPFIKVKRFPERQAERVAVDRDWIDCFCNSAPDRLAALAVFMFTTGARIGEATALQWADVDLGKQIAVLRDTKNGETHTVHLTGEMIVSLANLARTSRKVFGYTARWSIYKPWKATCARAALDYVPPHQAGRHSFATELIVRNGIDIATTADLGNWKSKTVLLERYAHGENKKAVIEDVFSRKTDTKIDTAKQKGLK